VTRGVFVYDLNQKEPCISSLYPDLDLCIQLLLIPIGPNLKVNVSPEGKIFCLDFKGNSIRVLYELGVRK